MAFVNSASCKHCGLQSVRGDFCCLGCEIAFKVIHESGLQDFYRLRIQDMKPVPAVEEERFSVFEHPDFLEGQTRVIQGYRQGLFRIEGLSCAACVWLLERLPLIDPSCAEARVRYGDGSIFLKWKDKAGSLSSMAKTLARLGYFLLPMGQSNNALTRMTWIRLGISGASAAGSMHLGLLFLAAHQSKMSEGDARFLGLLSAAVALPGLAVGAWPFFKSSCLAIRLKRLHPDQLVSLSIAVGFFYSLWSTMSGRIDAYFDSISMIIFLLLAGRAVVQKISYRLSKAPSWIAKIISDHGIRFVPAFSLQPGDRLRVDAGDIIPVDVILGSDRASINQSVLTGESSPVVYFRGQRIDQGASLTEGSVEVIVESIESESRFLRQLNSIGSISDTEGNKGYWQQIFTAVVLLLCGGVLLWEGSAGISKTLGLLLVTCPCALMLSEPLVLDSARRQAFQRQILLFKLNKFLKWADIRRIAFDKTGTLTAGYLELKNTVHLDSAQYQSDSNREFFLKIIFQMATRSQHPMSKALSLAFSHFQSVDFDLKNFQEIPGIGLRASFRGQIFEIKRNQGNEENPSCSFCVDSQEIMRFEFSDRPRNHLSTLLEQLKRLGLQVILLSGDRHQVVRRFAEPYQFDGIYAEASPETKKDAVSDGHTAFVGDGINDAFAMTSARVSLGLAGSAESAYETADAYLIAKDLLLIPQIIDASRRARRLVRLNLSLSLIYNFLTVYWVLCGAIGPILCAIFMPLSSLTVMLVAYGSPIFNSQRTRSFRRTLSY